MNFSTYRTALTLVRGTIQGKNHVIKNLPHREMIRYSYAVQKNTIYIVESYCFITIYCATVILLYVLVL